MFSYTFSNQIMSLHIYQLYYMDRITQLAQQITPNLNAGLNGVYTEQVNHFHIIFPQKSKNKLDWFKNNGWGFKDTRFILEKDGVVKLTGNRYEFSNEKMPKFKEWAENVPGINLNNESPAQVDIPVDDPIRNENFIENVSKLVQEITFDKNQRILHSHGHSLQEIYTLRHGKFERTVDCVVFINSHQQAVDVVKCADDHNVVLIPYGGGTNVTWALRCNQDEKRMIVSVDTTRMNHIKWVDRKNMTALVESGIIGKDLEHELARYGVCCGHEPDSVEFSSLGGWVSTRASGMKKNRYGNIEDIVLQIKIVTPQGVLVKQRDYPRISSGPDLDQLILGHEGTLGLITEVVIKVRPLPECQVYESILFYDFEMGIQFMYEVSLSKVWPASLRLVDNNQFQFGMALKTEPKSKFKEWVDKAKKYFVTEIMKFDPNQMTLATIVFEGSKAEVNYQQAKISEIAKKFKGFKAGSENGQRGYFLTFMIAYLRDFGLQYNYIAESFETACSWKNVKSLCENVKYYIYMTYYLNILIDCNILSILRQQFIYIILQTQKRIISDCKKEGVARAPFVSYRISQIYDSGATIYIYLGLPITGLADPLKSYCLIEDGAREEIMKWGGSISHHHGVGKLRKQFLKDSVGQVGVEILKKIKNDIDPKNIFANGNLI